MKRMIRAGKFKAECLKIMDEVKQTKQCIIITKHNKPIAKLVPIEEENKKIYGRMKGTVHIYGNIIDPVEENWNACS